ncbi:hypothetical protein HUSEC41_26247, partial [Escherichia coli O104:H4 str. 01-09591]
MQEQNDYTVPNNDIKKNYTDKQYLHVKDNICNIEIYNKSFNHKLILPNFPEFPEIWVLNPRPFNRFNPVS